MQTNPPPPVNIDEALVRRLISSQFPHWKDLPIRPVKYSGWDNRTFHLGETMSVRLPSAARYAAQVQKEQYWLPRLAPFLPVPIPVPLAMGSPEADYPWHWSVYRWLDGENAAMERIKNPDRFAEEVAHFLLALQKIDATGGPPPGAHNFYRGGSLAVYDSEAREAIVTLGDQINARQALKVWETALRAEWRGSPVWVHGDVAAGNLLVKNGHLNAVIDFGSSAVGDPACDLTLAWTFFTGTSRKIFMGAPPYDGALPFDGALWARARGWALWKASITLVEQLKTGAPHTGQTQRVITDVLQDPAG